MFSSSTIDVKGLNMFDRFQTNHFTTSDRRSVIILKLQLWTGSHFEESKEKKDLYRADLYLKPLTIRLLFSNCRLLTLLRSKFLHEVIIIFVIFVNLIEYAFY